MEKYWELNLTFLKSKREFPCRTGRRILRYKDKEIRVYKVHEYIKSKVIYKSILPNYLEMKRMFIIPSEVTITKEYLVRMICSNGVLLEETKMKSIMKYVVDRIELYLKPIEIIYFNYDSNRPFFSNFSNCFHTMNEKTQITYDRSGNEFKYYKTVSGIERYNLQGIEAKREIENLLMNNMFDVTPVESIATVFQTI